MNNSKQNDFMFFALMSRIYKENTVSEMKRKDLLKFFFQFERRCFVEGNFWIILFGHGQ